MDAVARAAVGFGLELDALRPLGGASGSAWSDGRVVLRVGKRVGSEVLALAAASGVVPVPRVLDRIELGDTSAVLLERVRGRPAGELAQNGTDAGAAIGRACGALHDALAAVECPLGLRDAPGGECGDRRLLHLDLHPFNVLVDDDGTPTGVIDWANAAGGDPELDRARTWSVLTLDPGARRFADAPGWVALTENWLDAGRMHALSPAARAWACAFMLVDLANRHTPAELAHVRDAMRLAQQQH